MSDADKFGFKKSLNLLKKVRTSLPPVLANTTYNHFMKGFEQGGFQTDNSRSGWPKRKRNYEMKRRGKKYAGGTVRSVQSDRALLVKSGTLRRSIKKLKVTPEHIEIGVKGLKYAEIHNDGLVGKAWGKHPFKMPQREFIGKSSELEKKILREIEKALKKVF